MKIWSLFTAASLAALSGCMVTPGSSSGYVGPSGPSQGGGGPAQPAPVGCAEELGADASDDFAVAPQVSTPQQPSTSFAGCLVPKDPGDVFAIAVPPSPAGTLYRFSALGAQDSGVSIELFDGDRRELISAHISQDNGARADLWIAGAPSSFLYFKLKSPHGNRFRPYDVQITATPIVDADEPNDDRDRPTMLALGAKRDALLFSTANGTDRPFDVYRVDVPRAGTLQVAIENVPSEIGLRALVFDATGRQLRAVSSHNDGAAVRVEDIKVAPGSYQVHVTSSGHWRPADKGDVPYRYARPYRVSATVN